MLFIVLAFIFLFNYNQLLADEYLDEIIIEDNLEESNTKKELKNTKNQSSSKTIEEKSNFFLRRSGGLGKNISFYIEGSSALQVNTSIEGFEYNIPSMTSFYPIALYFGNFDIITLNKDISASNRSSHSADIDFKISNKDYISFMLGSFYSAAFSVNQNFELKEDSFLNIGLSSLASKNNFDYIDINKNHRTRKNNAFVGSDIHIKYSDDNYKILNYTSLKYSGEPGSNQFEHLNAYSNSVENLTGIKYNKSLNIFDIEASLSNNLKKYYYFDDKYMGGNEVNFHFLFDVISLDMGLVFPLFEYMILSFKINNMFYFGKSYEERKKDGVDFLYEYYPSLFLSLEQFYFDEKLNISLKTKYFLKNILQYSFNIIYNVDENMSIAFLYKKGVRLPYVEELYYNSIFVKGNPNLKEERVRGGDLSFNIDLNNIKLVFNLYYKKVKNNIMFLPISFFMYRAKNIPDVLSRGLNVKFHLNLKYLEFLNIFNLNDSYFEYNHNDLPQTPKYQNKMSVRLKYKRFSILGAYKYTRLYYNNVFETDIIPSKHIFDLKLAYEDRRFKLNFNIENIGDNKKLYDSRHIPLMGRSFFIYLLINT